MTKISIAEVLFVIGLLLLGVALHMWFGMAAVVAYCGVVLVVVGFGFAYIDTRAEK